MGEWLFLKRSFIDKAALLRLFLFFWLIYPETGHAYIGPGAGFAFISSFFILVSAFFLAFFVLLSWPVRALFLYVKRRGSRKKSRVKRVIVIGLDGFDPELCERFMAEGALPLFSKLRETGSFVPLETTMPAISPVAWSTFATGVNPGKHQIFDFFTRDKTSYLPLLSSARISTFQKRVAVGPLKWTVSRPVVTLLRKSKAFWKILGEHKVFASVLRVPITFPPENFYGVCLSAMCAPDLLGTQGTYTLFTTEKETRGPSEGGGNHIHLTLVNNRFSCDLKGPPLKKNGVEVFPVIPLKGEVKKDSERVFLSIKGSPLTLEKGCYSPWVRIQFSSGFRETVSGMVRFLVTETTPCLRIYMTPVNIDPEKPALPISHPSYYAPCLSKLHGPFSTLGLAEDTWALNDGVIDETAFLTQAYDIYETRKTLLLDTIRRSGEGLITLVIDTTDRIQHMFFRYLSDDHPANRGKDVTTHKNAIRDLYIKMDGLLNEVIPLLKQEDLFMVISDHGFKSFKWGVNLNTWLMREGYLVFRAEVQNRGDWFEGVDWQKTRAFAYGLSGIFINTRGREKSGIVDAGPEKEALLEEIREKLLKLPPENQAPRPINRIELAGKIFKGPYVNESPDILIGYNDGYRASWNSVIGKVTDRVIEENIKPWSGDHAIDPSLVPGVFFSNWKLKETRASIMDLAPTICHMFGLEKEPFQDGRILTLYR